MFKQMKLRTRLLLVGLLLTATPLVVVMGIVLHQNHKMLGIAGEENERLMITDLDHIATGVYGMCQAHQELVQQMVDASLNVARDVLHKAGPVSFAPETATWDATNQFTQTTTRVDLPKMLVGQTWLGQRSTGNTSAPIVDEVKELVGGTCTIFQRMNPAGDMLRVCTNVEKLDGTRAIGTFIPASNPDGQPNPVVSAVLRGETFRGRAYVVNKWYITAYEPIFDAERKVVGVLYVGVPQESVASLRQAIMDIKVGETGYVYVLDSQGNYVVSQNGKRDGECIWNAKDADGTPFIQEIAKKATALKPGEVAEQLYPWQNPGDPAPRVKIARLVYFEPWDWIIGVGSYIDEFNQASDRIGAVGRAGNRLLIALWVATVGITTVIWVFIAGRLAKGLAQLVERLRQGGQQMSEATAQVAAASQSLAEGATEQAAGLEETSSSLEEMASQTRQNAENAQQANVLSDEAKASADRGAEAMTRLNQAIQAIQRSSDETAKIIKVIDEIAFQTNLLALNAAVEAARAGEAGKGFAVVAEEVRNLAMRSAEAAKNTSEMIEGSVRNAKNGVQIADEVTAVLNEIVGNVSKTSDLISEIAAASQEQSQGIDQVNQAVGQMDKVTQANAANAEETASASEELNHQADRVRRIVNDLVAIIGGGREETSEASGNQGSARGTSHRTSPLQHGDQVFHTIASGRPTGRSPADRPTKPAARRPEEEIPLSDGDDFEEFNR